MKEGGKVDLAQDKAVVKKAFKLHGQTRGIPVKRLICPRLKKGGRAKKANWHC